MKIATTTAAMLLRPARRVTTDDDVVEGEHGGHGVAGKHGGARKSSPLFFARVWKEEDGSDNLILSQLGR